MKRLASLFGAVLGIACLGFGLSSQANAGGYTVLDCHDLGGSGYTTVQVVKAPTSAPFQTTNNCVPAGGDINLRGGSNINQGDLAMLRYTAPTGAAFTGVKFGYTRVNHGGYTSDFYLNNANGANNVLIPNLSYGAPYVMGNWYDLPAGQNRTILRGVLKCSAANCSGTSAMTGFYRVNLKMVDFEPPAIVQRVGGNLVGSGPVSGTRTYESIAVDWESGISNMNIHVNSQLAGWVLPPCNPNFPQSLSPCAAQTGKVWTLNTTQAPFVEGLNSIRICANDYAQTGSVNTTCSPMEYFTVDN